MLFTVFVSLYKVNTKLYPRLGGTLPGLLCYQPIKPGREAGLVLWSNEENVAVDHK
jgi:hypothetical protein